MTTEPMQVEEPQLKKLDTLWWAVALIWAGVVYGAESLDFLPQIGEAGVWSWIFVGAGLFGLVLNFFSLSADDYQNPTTWDWIWSGGLTLVGAAAFVAFDFPWWLVLIVLGGAILISALKKQDQVSAIEPREPQGSIDLHATDQIEGTSGDRAIAGV